MTYEQKKWLDTKYTYDEKIQILNKLGQGKIKYDVELLKFAGVQKDLLKHIELKLPLLDKQAKLIDNIYYKGNKTNFKLYRKKVKKFKQKSQKNSNVDYQKLLENHLETLKRLGKMKIEYLKNL